MSFVDICIVAVIIRVITNNAETNRKVIEPLWINNTI